MHQSFNCFNFVEFKIELNPLLNCRNMNKRFFYPFLLFFLCQLSCKKQDNAYPQFPIELSLAVLSNGVQLNWSKVNTSDFIDYQVVSSTGDTIPDFRFLRTNPNVFVRTTIKDVKKTTFLDEQAVRVNQKTYYRVFVHLTGRVLASPNMTTSFNVTDLGGSFSEIYGHTSTNKPRFYLANSGKTGCSIYDPILDKITATGNFRFNNFSGLRMSVASQNGDNEEVAAIALGDQIAFNDATTLQSLYTYTFSNGVIPWAIVGTSDGFFIVITNEPFKNVKCISIGTHAILSQTTVNFGFTPSVGSIVQKNPSDRECVLRDPKSSFDSSRIARFRYSEQGQVWDIVSSSVKNTSYSGIFTNMATSADGAFYVINGSLVNRDLVLKKRVVTSNNSDYFDFCFNPTGGKLYGLFLPQSSSNPSIDEYNFPSLTNSRNFGLKISAFQCFVVNNNLLVFSDRLVQRIAL